MADTAQGSPPTDEAIKNVVLDILQEADLESTTEFKVRKLASEKLGADLNTSAHKKLVRKVVEDYLNSKAEGETEDKPEVENKPAETDDAAVEEDDKGPKNSKDESDNDVDEAPPEKSKKQAPPPKPKKQSFGDNEDQVVCQLSNKRNVSIQNFRGKTLISIREYYEKDGELRPGAKGISLSLDQWKVLKKNVPEIEKAIAEFK